MSLILLTALLTSPATPTQESLDAPPPGMVHVRGGDALIGLDIDDVKAIIMENEGMAGPLASETPQHTMKVEDFYLMTTPVTHEQYAAYVRATGAKPPHLWGAAALDEGRKQYLEEEAARRREALNEGIRLERVPFDPEEWWDKNWESCDWEVPENLLDHPVVNVTYYDVEAYARWAGLRPMTEFEYQYAARGKKNQPYPWGDKWDDKLYCNTFHYGEDTTQPVASFEEGAVGGIFDLVGNVWEWTSSPFSAYPKYKPVKVDVGRGKQKRTVEGLAGWDPNARVAVGGSYKNDKLAARVTTRRNTDRTQSTDALGFRCAADAVPGKDLLRWIIDDDVQFRVLPEDTDFYGEEPIIAQKWTSKASEVSREIPGYSVITGHEYFAFAPALQAPGASVKNLGDESEKNGPVVLGILTTTSPTLEPKLDPGTYFLTWREAAKVEEEEPSEDEEEEQAAPPLASFTEAANFNAEVASFIFFDIEGKPVTAVPATELNYDRPTKSKSPLRVDPWVPPDPEEVDEDDEDYVPPVPMDTVVLGVFVAGKHKSKGFNFDLPIKVKPDTIDDTWRR